MLLSYKYRVYPEGEVLERLERALELCRWVYNQLLEDRENAWSVGRPEYGGRPVSEYGQARLVRWLRDNAKPELGELNARMLSMIPRRISASIRALGELKDGGHVVGRLRYKKRGEYNTLEYNQSGFKIDVEHGLLELSKIGAMRARYHRPLPSGGVVKGVLVKRDHDRWYAIIQVEAPTSMARRDGGRRVELYFGLDYIVRDSDGVRFEHPHYYEKNLARIKKRQRNLSRKMKGSNNYHKAVNMLGRAHNKAEEQRRDYLHWISRYYVDRYDDITIHKPRLNPTRNTDTNRRLYDAGISKLISLIEYKAAMAGVRITIKPDNENHK